MNGRDNQVVRLPGFETSVTRLVWALLAFKYIYIIYNIYNIYIYMLYIYVIYIYARFKKIVLVFTVHSS